MVFTPGVVMTALNLLLIFWVILFTLNFRFRRPLEGLLALVSVMAIVELLVLKMAHTLTDDFTTDVARVTAIFTIGLSLTAIVLLRRFLARL
jgi:hypothetical protein